jgi:hypothetical protein
LGWNGKSPGETIMFSMKSLRNWLPTLTALFSALLVLVGYSYQQNLARNEDVRKQRQEIYSRLIHNISERNILLGRYEQTPEYVKASPAERSQLEMQYSLKDVDLTKNEGERTETISQLCLYGTDAAIDAYVKYAKANAGGTGGDLGQLILELRQSISPTHLEATEADLAIWNDPKYLR